MAQEDGYDLFQLNDGPLQPTFDVVLRGYDRRQVDETLSTLDQNMTALTTDRDAAYAQAQAYGAQVHRLQGELYMMRQ
jgi:peptidoglycan DL-endopeptidase RipA